MNTMDLFSLKGKVALITGAGSGLGRAFAKAMAEAGANVSCSDIDKNSAMDTARDIRTRGTESVAVTADVSKEEDVKEMVDTTVKELGRLDILFNNAGIAGATLPVHEFPVEDWDQVVAINLRGVFLCAKESLKVMVQQKKGKIINIASIFGLVGGGIFPTPAYTATKGAVVNFTREMALEYAESGININCIAPGFFAPTKLGGGLLAKDPEMAEMIASIIPTKKIGHPDDLKGAAVFLASPASDFVTGHTLVVDAGWMAK
ncbi:MAG: glucose 1-dehydrogenase [Thermodesulfobacteriota bacterium]|nr:glucose 1-dehydrogenase [Thermodesulfobacteriota bacterium]